jgi:glycine/D-amino acid oxidase-like deaminating enzyme
VVIVGGGFYGCCLALFMRSIVETVVLIEREQNLLTRASFANQARIHTGFHYPRSFVTARRSLALYQQFIADFADAVVDDFDMLYAIARNGSKVTAQRFLKMFADMGAPIELAPAPQRALFDTRFIVEVVGCREFAFDAPRLRNILRERLGRAGVRLAVGNEVVEVRPQPAPAPIMVELRDGATLSSTIVFDATYGQFANEQGPRYSGVPLKYELAEIALVDPPPDLQGLGITVMDGPFFSTMPFPAHDCYSLTHVRYTPRQIWTSYDSPIRPRLPATSAWLHMQKDAQRFMPVLRDLRFREPLYEVKTVPLRNESDDGRPIMLHRDAINGNYMTVLGGKLDNIYDLFDALVALGTPFDRAALRLVGTRSS